MFLHAWSIRFNHPVGDAPVELTSPLPPDCDDFLRGLRHA
jgi:hypothetical protein